MNYSEGEFFFLFHVGFLNDFKSWNIGFEETNRWKRELIGRKKVTLCNDIELMIKENEMMTNIPPEAKKYNRWSLQLTNQWTSDTVQTHEQSTR